MLRPTPAQLPIHAPTVRRAVGSWTLPRLSWLSLSLASLSLLSSCGGGSGYGSGLSINANNDNLSIAAGGNGQLLSNDSLGGVLVNLGLITFAITSGALPGGVTVVNGTVNISVDTTPGLISFSYQICEAASSSNCASASVQINVSAATIVANPDTFSLQAGSGATGNVLANDTLGGAPATAAKVVTSVSVTGGFLPGGISLSPAGLMSVAAGTGAGTYAVGYRICQITAPSNCANSTATLSVPSAGG
jgi:large repetitive protein